MTTEPKLRAVLLDDIMRGDFIRTIRNDYAELKEFLLSEERRTRLADMNRLSRFLHLSWWLLKSLLLRLAPARRLLLALGILFYFFGDRMIQVGDRVQVGSDFRPIAAALFLFVLMLELKDKLVAREELEAGRAVQAALMPERSPLVAGWELWLFTRSANEVGGDLLDFIRLDDGKFGVAVGDVAGKGLRAALLTTKLQSTLRAFVTDKSSLQNLGSRLNVVFNRDSLPSLFASLLYFELDEKSDAIRFVNAGHIPPMIVRTGGVEKMEKGGMALGLASDATFVEQSAVVRSGEMILAYSDGLTEAQNESGDFYGEQRVLNLVPEIRSLSAVKAGEKVVDSVTRFVGNARAADDITIAILKRA